MSIVVVIVSGFSAWLVLGLEYLIDVQSEEAVAFVYLHCLGVGGKKNVNNCCVIQLKICYNLRLVTAIT